ncbi:secretion system protein E [Candidatus Bathyarchaeota archaeon]|nr:secretion system protein E [Candidatus Bathyarchaeota archaeon]
MTEVQNYESDNLQVKHEKKIKTIKDLKAGLSSLKGYNDIWKERVENDKNLKDYLTKLLTESDINPELIESPSRELAKIKEPNFLYPVGEPVYIHIHTDADTKNIIYQAVEPRLIENRERLLDEVEKRIALSIDEPANFLSLQEKTDYLYNLLDSFIIEDKSSNITELKEETPNDRRGIIGKITQRFNKTQEKIRVDPDTYERLKYEIYCEKIGSSILEPMIRDVLIEDIHCSGTGPVYISHKIYGTMETSIILRNVEELNSFVLKLSEIVMKPVSHRDPIQDATMPDGSRINIVFGEDVSKRGSNFTIRKFSVDHISVIQLIKWGTLSSMMAAYIWILLEEKMSLWICGETASGKTTTLSAITAFIPESYKIVSIEEVPEVYVPHKNWVREVVRETGNASSEEQGAVSMFQLLKAALRQRPNYIIVGEIRGQEGNIAFQAMQTGHPVIATFHAATISKLVQRITNYPINIPKTHIDNLNAAIFQSAVNDPETGRYKRRALTINEILGYEPMEQAYNFVEVFTWIPSNDSFEFRGLGTSYLMDSKIAVMRGLPENMVNKIYDELFQRAEILEYMILLDIVSYNEVVQNIVWIQRVGIELAYQRYHDMIVKKFGREIIREIKEKLGIEDAEE